MLKRSVAAAVISLAALSFGRLPQSYDASLRMGRIGAAPAKGGAVLRADAAYANRGEWNPNASYSGSYLLRQGDTVSYGTWPSDDPNGKKLWWWAKFNASGNDVPGTIKEGGTSAWVLINSISATDNGTPNYTWKGWNGDIETKGAGVWAEIPTWRNGAEGAYSMTHDDLGSMPFDKSIKPGWDLAGETGFEEIKQSWGVFVGTMMAEGRWEDARRMVMDGHEIFNHSFDHTSAANRRFLYFPGDKISETDMDIPQEVRGFDVVGAWKFTSHKAGAGWQSRVSDWEDGSLKGKGTDINGAWDGPLRGACYWEGEDGGKPTTTWIDTLKAENDLVTIYSYPDWNGTGPGENGCGDWDEDGVIDGIYKIVPKEGTEIITLPTGQKMFVNKADKKVSVNVVGWYEPTDISEKFPFYESATSTNDLGRYGFMLNVFAAKGWTDVEKERNIVESNNILNANVYSWVGATPHFKNGKKSEYFGYPFDVYSEETHSYLESKNYTGARGGAKSGVPMPGDFFHPYRIDFDAFFINNVDWTPDKGRADGLTYGGVPGNPHVLLGLNEMIDEIIASKGYMVREFHAVADIDNGMPWNDGNNNNADYWRVNNGAEGDGGWWGGITKEQLRGHYNYLKERINTNKLVVYTPTEAVKYRMTANAVSGASIEPNGGNYTLTLTTTNIPEKYQDEISVIVSLSNATDKIAIEYPDGEGYGKAPYRAPKKMNPNSDGKATVWSVNVNPYRGAATIIPDMDWNGIVDSEYKPGDFVSTKDKGRTALKMNKISFAGIQSGKIALNLTKGDYTAELYNLQGRLIGRTDFSAINGVNATNLRTDNLAKGLFILNVKQAGKLMLNSKIMVK